MRFAIENVAAFKQKHVIIQSFYDPQTREKSHEFCFFDSLATNRSQLSSYLKKK